MVSRRAPLAALCRQHQRRALTTSACRRDHLARFRVLGLARAKVGPLFATMGEPDRRAARDPAPVEELSRPGGHTGCSPGSPDPRASRIDGSLALLSLGAGGSASAAERHCVGSTPKPRNTFRQAASVGSSLRGVSPIRSRAASARRGRLWRGQAALVVVDTGRVDDAGDDRREALDDARSYRKRATDPVWQMSGCARPRQGLGPSSPGCADPDDAGGELHQLEAPTPLIR